MSCSSEEKCFTFIWEIKNFEVLASHLKTDHSIDSPTYKVNHLLQEDCRLRLTISGSDQEFRFQLHGLPKYRMPVRSMIFFSTSDGEVFLNELQDVNSKGKTFVIQENALFGDNKESILPDHTLTVCCKIYDKKLETGEYRFHSTVHKLKYLWIIKKYDPSKFYTKTFFEKDNFLFYVSLDPKNYNYCFSGIIAGGMSIKDGTLNFVFSKWSIKGHDQVTYDDDDLYNQFRTAWRGKIGIDKRYSKKDLQLELESIYAVNTDSKTVPKLSNTLSNDIWKLYKEQLHTDATLNSADLKSFAAHRSILAARSPVFRTMFARQEMSEGRSGVVDIDDVDSKTMDRMLAFLYSDSLDDLQWEEAAALYYAADKYAIQSLKEQCANVMKEGLTVDNACDTLVLADKHSEKELLACVVDFISDHQEVVCSAKWRKLEEKNLRLTHEILRSSFLQYKRRK